MCLFTRNQQPKVAKKDIRVLKCLRGGAGHYETPHQNTQVTLGEPMVASPSTPDISYYTTDKMGRKVHSINGGAIHAMLYGSNRSGNVQKVAIIPAGTEYWISSFGRDIAAKQMIITEEQDYVPDVDFALDILEDAPEIDGVRVADYFYSDGSFKHPSVELRDTKPVGRVVGFHDGKPLIAALNILKGAWDTQYSSKIGDKNFGYSNDAIKDFSGRQTTQAYKEMDEADKSRFEAFEACINYGADNEEWYFPAAGEMTTALDNALFLNAAAAVTGLGEFIDDQWFWTCSQLTYRFYAWRCYLHDGYVGCYWDYKDCVYRVVPFFASFVDEKKKKSINGGS